MKIVITYQSWEEKKARTAEEFFRTILPGVRVRKSSKNPPYLCIYMHTDDGKRAKKT